MNNRMHVQHHTGSEAQPEIEPLTAVGAQLHFQLTMACQFPHLHAKFGGDSARLFSAIANGMRILGGIAWSNEGFDHAWSHWMEVGEVRTWSQSEADAHFNDGLEALQGDDEFMTIVDATLPDGTQVFLYIEPELRDLCSRNLTNWCAARGLGNVRLPMPDQ